MAKVDTVRGLRATRCEFSKRGIEIGRADITLTHGTLHIRGTLSIMRGTVIKDLRAEVEMVGRIMRQKPEIKNVLIECSYSEF